MVGMKRNMFIKANKKRRRKILADYIEENADKFDIMETRTCATGYMLKLANTNYTEEARFNEKPSDLTVRFLGIKKYQAENLWKGLLPDTSARGVAKYLRSL